MSMTETSTDTYSTRALTGKRVFGGKSQTSRIGKVERFIFLPTQNVCVGFTVKRPDLALMFHRSDMFVPLDAFSVEDDHIIVDDSTKDATGDAAIKRLGINWDKCVMWEGMPLMKESGEAFGTVADIEFSATTGEVISVTSHRGATAQALVGSLVIPAEHIVGFRIGIGTELAGEWVENEQGEEELLRGAIVISDAVGLNFMQGGIAEAAGHGAARAQDKARRAAESVKPKAEEAAKTTGEAVNKGAFVTGRQIGRAKGMFSAFKEEYDKASGKNDGTKKRK